MNRRKGKTADLMYGNDESVAEKYGNAHIPNSIR